MLKSIFVAAKPTLAVNVRAKLAFVEASQNRSFEKKNFEKVWFYESL